MTLSAEKLKELLGKVERATSADREIDALLGDIADLYCEGQSWSAIMEHGLEFAVSLASRYQSIWFTVLPYYTASVDAALALVERLRPDWAWKLVREDGRHVFVLRNALRLEMPAPAWVCSSALAPMAILSALLKSLENQNG